MGIGGRLLGWLRLVAGGSDVGKPESGGAGEVRGEDELAYRPRRYLLGGGDWLQRGALVSSGLPAPDLPGVPQVSVENILRSLVPTRDEAWGMASTIVTALFERVGAADAADAARLGLAIAKRAIDHEEDPKAYLQSLLDQVELNAQARARARFGG